MYYISGYITYCITSFTTCAFHSKPSALSWCVWWSSSTGTVICSSRSSFSVATASCQASLNCSACLCSGCSVLSFCHSDTLGPSHTATSRGWACLAYFCCLFQRWYDDWQELLCCCQINGAGWACCFHHKAPHHWHTTQHVLSVVKTASGSHWAVEEQLRPGIPHQALAAQVHVCCKVKLVGWLWIVWIGGNQPSTVLQKQISKGNMFYIVLHDILCTNCI
jgi:hypothetical protein